VSAGTYQVHIRYSLPSESKNETKKTRMNFVFGTNMRLENPSSCHSLIVNFILHNIAVNTTNKNELLNVK